MLNKAQKSMRGLFSGVAPEKLTRLHMLANQNENVLGEHRLTTPMAVELSKVLLYSVQKFFGSRFYF